MHISYTLDAMCFQCVLQCIKNMHFYLFLTYVLKRVCIIPVIPAFIFSLKEVDVFIRVCSWLGIFLNKRVKDKFKNQK